MKALVALFALFISAQVLAFAEPGRWSSGWGQGVSEYTAVVDAKNNLYVACTDDGETPATMTLTLNGRRYGPGNPKDFVLIVDGKGPYYASDAGSSAGGDNFRAAWDGMRKAKSIVAKTTDGKTLILPTTGANALPSSKSKQFPCYTW